MDIIFIDDLQSRNADRHLSAREGRAADDRDQPAYRCVDRFRGASDDIRDTIDYAVVAERLRTELGARHFNLLEKLAEYVATLLLEDFGAQWVRVSVAKLGMMRGVRRVGVVIEARRCLIPQRCCASVL